ncbi:hypothetical protein ZIOFF_024321 [Zingiber officinale]|uniref:Transmembrane protein n=1 Tax=Zingiber officinale TaxID=94328 RepID=A0A8J5H865_ZINOF|nr:hypothetical protein ZIOFF_024321 [Zingiber officinale]
MGKSEEVLKAANIDEEAKGANSHIVPLTWVGFSFVIGFVKAVRKFTSPRAQRKRLGKIVNDDRKEKELKKTATKKSDDEVEEEARSLVGVADEARSRRRLGAGSGRKVSVEIDVCGVSAEMRFCGVSTDMSLRG